MYLKRGTSDNMNPTHWLGNPLCLMSKNGWPGDGKNATTEWGLALPGGTSGAGSTFCFSNMVYNLFHIPFIVKILCSGAFTNKNDRNWPHRPTPDIYIKTSDDV